jgi:hypothetical protein
MLLVDAALIIWFFKSKIKIFICMYNDIKLKFNFFKIIDESKMLPALT